MLGKIAGNPSAYKRINATCSESVQCFEGFNTRGLTIMPFVNYCEMEIEGKIVYLLEIKWLALLIEDK